MMNMRQVKVHVLLMFLRNAHPSQRANPAASILLGFPPIVGAKLSHKEKNTDKFRQHRDGVLEKAIQIALEPLKFASKKPLRIKK